MARSTGIGVFAISILIVVLVAIISGYYINVQAGRIRELESQLNTWMNNYNQLYSEHQELTKKYNELTTDYNTLLDNYNRLSADYKDLSSRYTELTQEFNALNANYTALQGMYASLKSSYESLQNQYQTLSTEYNLLNTNYITLVNSYNALKAERDQLYSEYTRFIDWYNTMRDQVNSRSIPSLENMTKYITPDDPAVISSMYSITGGWSNPGDWNEYWSDVYKLYKWVADNIMYSYDSPEPVLPGIGGYLAWRDDFWRFPNETLRDGTGDCEDMANLLASLILAYNGKRYYVWAIYIVFDNSAHVAVALPVQGGMLTILDPAGHYYTSSYGSITARDVATELQKYFNYWASAGYPNGRVYAIYSYNIYKVFNSTQEFIQYVKSLS